MKKDSFTFSDKLKKSKTLPLSKRIPSRVGGEVKAKRTLFERAQRDLPFIIVAALALLLLPFLSRESVEIETPSVVWGEGDGYLEELNQPASAEGEMDLSSFRNPLDLIIRDGEGEGSAKDTIDTLDSESESSSEYSAQSSYNNEYEGTAPATSKYGKTVRRSVRNSVSRAPTAIGSLSRGGMVSADGGRGVSHNLSMGSRSRGPAPKTQSMGVRPVALQPLTAAGKGRDLTGGDALYAEAARSIGAMNTPGAKQALMEAQLKDVDGKPLGDTKGDGSAAAAASKPGAGGGPSNSWTNKPIKPWWWDMMNQRSQMRWKLWHYNWEEMASKNLITWTSNIASCLIMGSQNGDASKFLGAMGGGTDYECYDSAGNIIDAVGSRSDFIEGIATTTKTKDGGSETQVSPEIAIAYENFCKANGGHMLKSSAPRKSALDVRLRCLGMKLSELKNKVETKRKATCDGLYSKPMYVTITAKRNGKVKENKLDTTGIYVVGAKSFTDYTGVLGKSGKSYTITPKKQCVVYLSRAKYGQNFIPENVGAPGNKIVIYRVNSYTLLDDAYLKTDDVVVAGKKYHETFDVAKAKIDNNECLTEEELHEILKPLGTWKAENTAKHVNEIEVCSVPKTRLLNTDITPRMKKEVSTASEGGIICNNRIININETNTSHAISATIKNPAPRTLAFVLEKTQGGPSMVGSNGDKGKYGYVVKRKIDFSQDPTSWTKIKRGDTTTFIGDFIAGLSTTITNDVAPESTLTTDASGRSTVVQNSIPTMRSGEGYVVWINTDDMTTPGVEEYSDPVSAPSPDLLFPTSKGRKAEVCKYIWGCTSSSCALSGADVDEDNYCVDTETGKIYPSKQVGDYNFKTSNTPITDDLTYQPAPCDPLCKMRNGNYGVDVAPQPIPMDLAKLTAAGVDLNCPVCNHEKPLKADGYCLYNNKAYAYKLIGGYKVRITTVPSGDVATDGDCDEICAKKAEALGLGQPPRSPEDITIHAVNDDDAPVEPTAQVVKALGGIGNIGPVGDDPLCPYCNPLDNVNPDDSGLCRLGNNVYRSKKITGKDSNTYYIRIEEASIPNANATVNCTTICAAKARALGIFKTTGENSTVPVGTAIADREDISPVRVPSTICPYCSDQNDQENGDPNQGPIPSIESCQVDFDDIFEHAKSDVFQGSKVSTLLPKTIDKFEDCIRRNPKITTIEVEGYADASSRGDNDSTQTAEGLVVPSNPDDRGPSLPECTGKGTAIKNIALSMNRARFITNKLLYGYNGAKGLTSRLSKEVNFTIRENKDANLDENQRYGNKVSVRQPAKNSKVSRDITVRLTAFGSYCAKEKPICDADGVCTDQTGNRENMSTDRRVLAFMTED